MVAYAGFHSLVYIVPQFCEWTQTLPELVVLILNGVPTDSAIYLVGWVILNICHSSISSGRQERALNRLGPRGA